MLDTNFINLLILMLAVASITYRISFLSKKSIGYFSLLQLLFLVVIPGFIYTLAYSYLNTILSRPLNSKIIIPDSLLVNFFLLALLFSYGGIAIHAVTKMLWESFEETKSQTYKINTYFHLTFSHNLIFSGALVSALTLTLIELNHAPQSSQNLFWAFVKGIVMGSSIISGIFWYNPYEKITRWSDLKTFFMVIWIGFIFIIYGIYKLDPSFRDYELLLPVLITYSMVSILSAVLVLRRLKRGGFAILFGFGKKKEKILEIHPEEFLQKKQSPTKKS